MDSLFDILLGKSLSGGGGGGGGGTSNYNALENKPQINGTTLTGNKSLSDLGIAAASDIPTVNNGTLTIQKNGTKIDEFKANQSANTTINITVPTTASDVSALPDTTKYAASSTAGGSATSAVKLDNAADAGATNKPVYFNNGKPTAIAYEVNKAVPADAVFTDTTYESKAAASGGTAVSLVTTGEKYTWNNKSDLELGNTATTAAAGNHTHTLNIATGAGTSQISLAPNTKYKLTGGGETYVFTTPADTTYTFDGTYSASTNKAATVSTVTNAINALDVTGESGISAAKTISAWSETDGKVSVSTQDIAITGTQAVLTGYQKSTTAGQAVAATDNVNQAIGKVEKRVSDNENNISITDITANFTAATGYTIQSGISTVYKQGKHVFGTLSIKIDSGNLPTTNTTIATNNTDKPNSATVLPCGCGADEWSINNIGMCYYSQYTGEIKCSDTVSTNTCFNLQLNYVTF